MMKKEIIWLILFSFAQDGSKQTFQLSWPIPHDGILPYPRGLCLPPPDIQFCVKINMQKRQWSLEISVLGERIKVKDRLPQRPQSRSAMTNSDWIPVFTGMTIKETGGHLTPSFHITFT